MEYVPFLKLKQNELAAIHELESEYSDSFVPLLDIPRSQTMDDEELISKIESSKKQLGRYHDQAIPFYLDVFDIDPTLRPAGLHPYGYVLTKLSDWTIYPVVGLDRDLDHIQSAVDYMSAASNSEELHVAIRLLPHDIEHYIISERGIKDLYNTFATYTNNIDIIIDVRNVFNRDIDELIRQAETFTQQLISEVTINELIFSCCSIPNSISEAVPTESSGNVIRHENTFFNTLKHTFPNAVYGDYTIVSPEYTDVPIELFYRVSAPKIIYTCTDDYYIVRGGAFSTHKLKYKQYYDLAKMVYDYYDYRGEGYSYGDDYVAEKKDRSGGPGSPSTWLKAMINSHITFILEERL